MSGFECAGVVLAVLPLFIGAVKAYRDEADTLWGVVIHSRAEEALKDFYYDFYYEIWELQETLQQISDNASVSVDEDSLISWLSAWEDDPAIKMQIKASFPSVASFHAFEMISRKIVDLLGRLVGEPKKNRKTLGKGSHTDNERLMFDTLKSLAVDSKSHKTKSTFAERFRFFKNEKDRKTCVKNLGKWNERLRRTLEDRGHGHGSGLTHDNSPSLEDLLNNQFLRSLIRSPATIREATQDLYTTLSSCWACGCQIGHEARLCLDIERALEQPSADIPITFDLLFSVPNGIQSKVWKEGTILFKFASDRQQRANPRLWSLCESLNSNRVRGYRLRIMTEHMAGRQTLWEMDPRPPRLSLLKTKDPVSLHGLLDDYHLMSQVEKCGLGLIVTYSLLLFHGSQWNAVPWDKNALSFFHKATDEDPEPDYLRPFITTRFENANTEVGEPGGQNGLFHRNYNIMMLGVLLIEIFERARIERFRNRQEQEDILENPSTEANVNLNVARRVARKMDDAFHRAAILACLYLDWIPEGEVVRIEDSDVRTGLLKNVIEPLKTEQRLASASLP